MSPNRKADLAAKLAALQYGVPVDTARNLILFWFDAETVSPMDPVEKLALTVRDAMVASGSILVQKEMKSRSTENMGIREK
jgi:hypothetical protein